MRYVLLLPLLILMACQEAPSSHVYPPVRFQNTPPIALNIQSVEVVNDYAAPYQAPNVEHHMPYSFEDMISQWAKDRIQPSGQRGQLVISIQEASMKEAALPLTKGIKGAFTKEQSERYDSKLLVTTKLYTGESSLFQAQTEVSVTKSRSLREDATIAGREQLLYDIGKEMMGTFDVEMQRQIRQNFSGHMPLNSLSPSR